MHERRALILLISILLFVVASCGDDDAATTSVTAVTTNPVVTTTSAATTTLPATTTVATADPIDCTEVWPEGNVQAVAGADYEFIAANPDLTACTFLGDSGGIALAGRASTREEFDLARDNAGDAGTDLEACDGGFFVETDGSTLIMEVYSESQGRAFTATITGASTADALEWVATVLLTAAC